MPLKPLIPKLQISSPAIDALREADRSTRGYAQTIKAIEASNAAMVEIFKAPGISEALAQAARTSELVHQATKGITLPDTSAVTKLLNSATFTGDHHAAFTRIAEISARMDHAWLDVARPAHSIAGLAALTRIADQLKQATRFSDQLAETLRLSLGDWRQPIDWPETIFHDAVQRSAFYRAQGFDDALTDFSEEAFDDAVVATDLDVDPPTLVTIYGDPIAPADADYARNNLAYDWLTRLESHIRSYIDQRMSAAFGPGWEKHKLPNGMHERWQEKRQKDRSGTNHPLIAYADFTDYEPLITRKDVWREIFSAEFGRVENLHEAFQRLYPIRVATMHARPITQDDELILFTETRHLSKVVIL